MTKLFDTDELPELQPPPPQLYDMAQEQPQHHHFERIVGNELRCISHDGLCPVIRIKPTEVLERGVDGTLQLIDKAPKVSA